MKKISTYYEDTELNYLGLLLFYFCSMLTDLQYRNELMEMEVEHYLELPLPHTSTLSLSLSLSRAQTYIYTHTHTNTHTHARAHTHTHTHTKKASYTHFHNHWTTLGKLLMDDSFLCLFIFNVPPSVKTLRDL